MTPGERHEKYRELELTDRHDDSRVVVYIHRRCSCLVDDPEVHEKVCFDPPVQLELAPEEQAKQEVISYLFGGK